MKGYYFITDADLSCAGNLSDVRNAVAAGVPFIQYRCKSGTSRFLYEEAAALCALCTGTGTRFIVNDRIDIALAVDADGVHLGQDDIPCSSARRLLGLQKIIGITVHNLPQALQAASAGADYLGVSPIFATTTKQDAGRACSLETLRAVRKACKLPLAAIGGINLNNAGDVIAAGADLICAISAVVTSRDVQGTILKFQAHFR